MVKREKKSLASLIGSRDINPVAIDEAATEVHKKQEPEPRPSTNAAKEKQIRVSVDTPRSLYMKCKETALEEEIGSLKDFYLHCVTAYLKNRGKL